MYVKFLPLSFYFLLFFLVFEWRNKFHYFPFPLSNNFFFRKVSVILIFSAKNYCCTQIRSHKNVQKSIHVLLARSLMSSMESTAFTNSFTPKVKKQYTIRLYLLNWAAPIFKAPSIPIIKQFTRPILREHENKWQTKIWSQRIALMLCNQTLAAWTPKTKTQI